MRTSWMCAVWLTMATACGVNTTGGGGNAGSSPRQNTATTLTLSGTRFYAEYRNGTLTTLPDGDIVVAALLADDKGYNADLGLVRLDSALSLKWAVRLDEKTVPTHLVQGKDGSLFLIAGESYPGSLRVLRLDADTGAVRQAVEFDNLVAGRALPLDDGGLLLTGGNLLRVDARLKPVWARQISATHAVPVADGFLVAGVPLGAGGRMSGIGLTKVSAGGQVEWKTFTSPGPGNHSLSGLRTLADGSVMVGLGNNSTRSDNVALLKPFVLATFDARGRLLKMTRAELAQRVPTSTGTTEAPLQFGSGHSLVAVGQDTWMSFTANSGVLGSNVITHVLARFAADGTFQEARYAGLQATSGPGNSTLSFSLLGPSLTLHQVFPEGTGCVDAPTKAAFTPIEPTTEYTAGSSVPATELPVKSKDLIRTAAPLAVTLTSGCAMP